MDRLFARASWPSLTASRLALIGMGLVALVLFHMWAAGQAVAWVGQVPSQRTWVLDAIGLINGLVTGTLLACLLVAALRCDQGNDLRFLGLLGGSVFGLLLLLGSPDQRFDRLGYTTLRSLQEAPDTASPMAQGALEAVRNRDVVALHRMVYEKAHPDP